jgi:TIR domain
MSVTGDYAVAVRSRDPQSPDRRGLPSTREPGRGSLRVFLSYRREDASGHAGRLYDLLAARYGAERVFMDIDAIPLGSEFDQTISRAVASCDVLIALIGRGWLQATDAGGRRRLDDPDDFVRREIESALAQGVVVVPASIQGAEIPRADELPASLTPLTRRQGFQLSDTGWRDDVGRLIRRLEAVGEHHPDHPAAADRPPHSRRPRPTGRTLAAVVLGFLLLPAALAAVLLLRGGGDGRDGSSPKPEPPSPTRRVAMSGLKVERPVTFGAYLRRIHQPRGGLTDAVVNERGALVSFDFVIEGFKGRRLPLVRQLIDARGGDVLGEDRDISLKPEATKDSGNWPIWVPLRRAQHRRVFIQVQLYEPRGIIALKTLRTRTFPVK